MIVKHVLRFTKLEPHQQQNVILWQQSGSRSQFDNDDVMSVFFEWHRKSSNMSRRWVNSLLMLIKALF